MKPRALIVGMNFYNYEKAIAEELSANGYNVNLIEDVPLDYTKLKRFLPARSLNKIVMRHQEKELKKIHQDEYQFILVIVGRFLTKDFLMGLKSKCTSARMILYLWDDVARVENFEDVKECYDLIYSFDPIDCYKYEFCFLPLFYTREYKLGENEKKEYYIYSALSNHSDRIKIVKRICNQYETKPLLFYINMGRIGYLRYYAAHLFKGKKADKRIQIRPKPIDKKINNHNMVISWAILDIPFSGQVGLTIRTLEALGSGIKLITTNKSIQYYDFYDPNNICIIDNKNPVIPESFFEETYKDVRQEIYVKYSLEHWVSTLVNNSKNNYLKKGTGLGDINEM